MGEGRYGNPELLGACSRCVIKDIIVLHELPHISQVAQLIANHR